MVFVCVIDMYTLALVLALKFSCKEVALVTLSKCKKNKKKIQQQQSKEENDHDEEDGEV